MDKNFLLRKEKVEEKSKGKITLISLERGKNISGTFKCLKCEHEFNKRYNAFIEKNHDCPACDYTKNLKTKQEEVNKLNSTIKLNNWIVGRNVKQIFECTKCNCMIERRYDSFKKDPTCPTCKENDFFNNKANEISLLSNGKIKLVELIKTNNMKARCCCSECKQEFTKRIIDFKENPVCPVCEPCSSKNEVVITNILLEEKINYASQYRIDDCRNILPLPFDFALFDNSNNLKCLIEYDGEDHFKVVKRSNSETKEDADERFKQRKINDNIKSTYCKINGIPLIRISYKEQKNIEEIVKEKIKEYL